MTTWEVHPLDITGLKGYSKNYVCALTERILEKSALFCYYQNERCHNQWSVPFETPKLGGYLICQSLHVKTFYSVHTGCREQATPRFRREFVTRRIGDEQGLDAQASHAFHAVNRDRCHIWRRLIMQVYLLGCLRTGFSFRSVIR